MLQYLNLWDNGQPLNIFSIAPRLTTVRLEGEEPQEIALPTNQLTKLSVSCRLSNQCIKVLSSCPNVTHCAFLWLSDHRRLIPVCAPLLESLELGFVDEYVDILGRVFDCFTLPVARELSIHATGQYFPEFNFISLVSRSSCSLQSLSLSNLKLGGRQLINCLRVIPSLQKLSLRHVLTDIDQVFRESEPYYSLTSSSSSTPYLIPNLKSFEWIGHFYSDCTLLVSFLRSRWEADALPGIARLESVKFNIYDNYIPDGFALDHLGYLLDEGMKVEFVILGKRWL